MTHLAAIWMDHNEARVISLGEPPNEHTLAAHIRAHDHHTHPKHGDGDRHPADRRFLEDVKAAISGCDRVVLFGPGQARHELVALLEAEHSPLAARVIGVLPLDRLTDAQIAVKAREAHDDWGRMHGVHVQPKSGPARA